jgi:hypothetical protein
MKKSKFKTLLKEYGYFDVDEAKKPSKYNFEQVAADYKDFEGFIDDLLPTLKKLGLYAINDPVYNGSDSYGILISKSPITKAELKTYSNEFYGDGEEEELDENFGGKNPSSYSFETINFYSHKDSDGVLKDLKKVGKKLGFNVTTKDYAGDKFIIISHQGKKYTINKNLITYQIEDVLKKLKFYTIPDPTEDSNTKFFGILVSKSPISKAELKAYRDEMVGDEEEELDENFGGKNPEADKKVKRLLMQFVKELDITEGEAADLIRSSLKRIANS